MAIANPRIHIICGICGCNKLLKYELGIDIDADSGEEKQTVTIICTNCNSITGLEELMEEEK